MDDEKFCLAVQAARIYLVMSYPFYSYLLHRASIVGDTGIPTACVDVNGRIRINPAFFMALKTPENQAFILAHEILHPAFGYFWRSAKHHPRLANRAHDYVINLLLEQESAQWVVSGSLLDKKFTGMPYEEVYCLLKNNLPTMNLAEHGEVRVNAGASGDGGAVERGKPQKIVTANEGLLASEPVDGVVDVATIGGIGIDIDFDVEPVEPIDWGMEVARAAEAARMKGCLPAHLARFVGALLTPVIPWQDKLRLAITEVMSRTRDDWTTPHRRSEAYGYYAPTERFLGFDVSVCVDTSGSIGDAELRRAVSEIRSIVEQTGGDGRYIVGDAAVHADIALMDFHPKILEGGGGTSFIPHFEHLELYPTKLCVFFTDTFGDFPEREPAFPVIWAVYKPAMAAGAAVPFGEIIEVEV